ncbi:hypothetical protein F4X88_13155 [Candidatus Poribacteria bacterium]|nr:hypothetical protein [Candidatus Poribacteria bacterium]
MDEKQELLEIYKLHTQLADNVSNRRATANRFYILVLPGLAVLFSAFLQHENGVPLGWLMIGFGLFGMLLAAAWYIVIRSYRQLNSGKFKALHELEEKLAYPFFKREWELLTLCLHSIIKIVRKSVPIRIYVYRSNGYCRTMEALP